MTPFTVSFLERRVQDFVHQAPVFRAVCFMAAGAICLVNGDSRVSIRHSRIINVVTTLAKGCTFACKQAFNVCIVWHMAFQTHPLLYRRVLKFVLFNMKRQVRVA
jgi:hypothetical protein